MILSKEDWNLLQYYVGQGNISKSNVIFFGNEFGLASTSIENYISFIKERYESGN
ncbi:MAG: hypothetical protein ACOC1K_03260 [Nanoarchaeota archaeon]